MKFDRLKLIERIDQIEALDKARLEEARKQDEALYQAHLDQWDNETKAELINELEGLLSRVRGGERITETNIEESLGINRGYRACGGRTEPVTFIAMWVDSRKNHRYVEPQDDWYTYTPSSLFKSVRDLLTRTEDEFVSSSMLKELGISAKAFVNAAVM